MSNPFAASRAIRRAERKADRLLEESNGNPTIISRAFRLMWMAREVGERLDKLWRSPFGDITRGVKRGYPPAGVIPVAGSGMSFPRNAESEKLSRMIQANARTIIPQDKFYPPAVIGDNPLNSILQKVVGRAREDDSRTRANWDWNSNWMYREAPAPEAGYESRLPATAEQAARMRNEDAWKNAQEKDLFAANDRRDEYQRRFDSLYERYGGGKNANASTMASETLRAELLKELPAFFRNSKISTKRLIEIHGVFNRAKGLGSVFGIPLNPMTAAVTGTAFVAGMYEESNRANTKVVSWGNAENLYGKETPFKYGIAAMLAGETDYGNVIRRFGKMSLKYGGTEGAMSIYRAFSENAKGKSGFERAILAQAFGLDETDVAIADVLTGNLKIGRARKVASEKAILDFTKEYGLSSDGGFAETALAALLLPTITRSAIARSDFGMPNNAASNVSISINGPVNVESDNPKEFVRALDGEVKSRSNTSILEANDSKGF